MKNLNILILYKNKETKIISAKKIKPSQLSGNDIKMIFIPLYDNPNAYIPIKPNILYNFSKAKVSIEYQAFIYDYEDERGSSFDTQNFYSECTNIIDFINAIYNCYKFRGVTIYLENAYQMTTSSFSNFVIYPRHIKIKFYDTNNILTDEIDSGPMEDLSDYDSNVFKKTPPAYVCENRMECLKDILYVPQDIDNSGEIDSEKMPISIQLYDDSWRKVKKPAKELLSTDYILYRVRDFEIYYLMEYQMYCELLKIREFDINYISSPIDTSAMDDEYFNSLDDNKVPSFSEKREVVEMFIHGEVYNIISACASIRSPDSFIESLIFFRTIISYIKYFGIYCYADSDLFKIRTFAIFCRYYPAGEYRDEILLTDLESDYDTVNKVFLEMITKG